MIKTDFKKKEIKALRDRILGPIRVMQMTHRKVEATETFLHLRSSVWTTHTAPCVLRGWGGLVGLKLSPVPVCERVKLNVDIPTTSESKALCVCVYVCEQVVTRCINHTLSWRNVTLIYSSQGAPS